MAEMRRVITFELFQPGKKERYFTGGPLAPTTPWGPWSPSSPCRRK